MRLSVLLSLISVPLLLSFSQTVKAQIPLYDEAGRTLGSKDWQVDFQTTYYQATANYSQSGGEYTSLASGHDYKLIDVDFGVQSPWWNQWSLYAAGRVSNAESNDGTNTRRNSSFTQAVLGVDKRFVTSRRFLLAADFSTTLPFARVDATADEALNREGALEISGKLIARAKWSLFEPFAFLGYTYRDEGRASLLPYGVGAELQFSRWYVGGELRGYQSVTKDKYSDNRIQRESVASKNGGALRYFTVDPALSETNFWLRGPISSNWDLRVGAGSSITGTSTSAGWNLIAGLSYSFEALGRRIRSAPEVDAPAKFQEEVNDGVDQNLFQPSPPPPPPPKPNPQQNKTKIQNDLNQTEFQIELKRKRK